MNKIRNSTIFPISILLFSLIILLSGCGKSTNTQPEPPTPTAVEPAIEVNPATALIDKTVNIRVSGLPPGERVIIRANMRAAVRSRWESWAAFTATESGRVDLSIQQPAEGTYNIVDPMGLFWSMQEHKEIDVDFSPGGLAEPLIVHLSAEVDGNTIASVQVERFIMSPDVVRTPVRENGLVGTFFLPDSEGIVPAIIILGGSGGGMNEAQAALLASHGYATFALAYFGMETLPGNLSKIPLEYFENAITWLQKQEQVNADQVGVVGASRGGELALLLGATFPQIKAVVAYAPSGLVWEGLATSGKSHSAWSYQGRPLAYVPFIITPEFQKYVNEQTAYAKPFALTPPFSQVWKRRMHLSLKMPLFP